MGRVMTRFVSFLRWHKARGHRAGAEDRGKTGCNIYNSARGEGGGSCTGRRIVSVLAFEGIVVLALDIYRIP